MATYTEHYNLIKPALNDKVNINNLNDNADIIDSALNNKVDTDETQNITTSANKCMLSDGVTSVEEALGMIEKFEYKAITDTTDANGLVTTRLQARYYIFIGTLTSASVYVTPINAISDGVVRLRFADASGSPLANTSINIGCIFAKVS